MQTQVFTKEDAADVVRRFRLLVLTATIIVSIGSVFYHFVEHWKWIDCIYFSVVSLLTVGYGDFVPTTDAGKIFAIFYLITGVGFLAALANNIIKRAMVYKELKKGRVIEVEKSDAD